MPSPCHLGPCHPVPDEDEILINPGLLLLLVLPLHPGPHKAARVNFRKCKACSCLQTLHGHPQFSGQRPKPLTPPGGLHGPPGASLLRDPWGTPLAALLSWLPELQLHPVPETVAPTAKGICAWRPQPGAPPLLPLSACLIAPYPPDLSKAKDMHSGAHCLVRPCHSLAVGPWASNPLNLSASQRPHLLKWA